MMVARNQDEYMNIFDQISQYMFRMNVPVVSWGIKWHRTTEYTGGPHIAANLYCSYLSEHDTCA